MHDVPRKDREDADDVDEDEVAEVGGGFNYMDPDGTSPVPDYPHFPVGITDPLELDPSAE
jgi:hypothetical protein